MTNPTGEQRTDETRTGGPPPAQGQTAGKVIIDEGTSPTSLNSELLLELRKALLTDSLEAGRNFCAVMTQTSIAAVAVYLALLALALPQSYRLSWWPDVVAAVVVFLLLGAATAAFSLGAWPRSGILRESAHIVFLTPILEDYRDLIQWRSRLIKIGMMLFYAGLLGGAVITGLAMYHRN